VAFILDLIVTYLWVIGLSNAFNFIDSMDGLLTQFIADCDFLFNSQRAAV